MCVLFIMSLFRILDFEVKKDIKEDTVVRTVGWAVHAMMELMELRIYQEDAALLQTISLHEPGLCVCVCRRTQNIN